MIRARIHAISVEQYHKMIERGTVTKNVELIRGALVEKMSQSPLHASSVEIVREYLTEALRGTALVRQEKPLTLADSEPEPDLAVVPGVRSDYLSAHPTSARLVIEVVVVRNAAAGCQRR